MIKHIVLFKFKSDIGVDDRKKRLAEIKQTLEALRESVSELLYIEVGLNANPQERYDLSLISEFNSWEDLKTYVVHPEHQKVAVLIRKILEERACVDYEF